jgi:hypothetical protein
MKNKALYIGIGVVALGGLIYFMMRKKGADSVETKSAETTEATDATAATTPSKGSALTTTQPAAPTCGCGAGQIPCPNQRCASKTILGNRFAAKMEKPQASTSVPKADPETEKFAFNLTF